MATTPVNRPDPPLAALVHTAGSKAGDEIPIRTPVVRIGQGSKNDVNIDDDTVSTQHARLEYDAGGWRVTDLESRNGTYLDGTRLAPGVPTPLAEGALLAFGTAKLSFRAVEGADAEGARATYRPQAEKTPLAERSSVRLPLWVVVAVLLVLALLVGLFLWFGGDPSAVEPALEGVARLISASTVSSPS
jgi:hypothetical protein